MKHPSLEILIKAFKMGIYQLFPNKTARLDLNKGFKRAGLLSR
jgi:hypothetical protein